MAGWWVSGKAPNAPLCIGGATVNLIFLEFLLFHEQMKCLAGKQAGRHPAYRSALGEPAAFFLFVVFYCFLKNMKCRAGGYAGKDSVKIV